MNGALEFLSYEQTSVFSKQREAGNRNLSINQTERVYFFSCGRRCDPYNGFERKGTNSGYGTSGDPDNDITHEL